MSAGISAGLIVSILLPVPLLLHGLAQVCARHAGADVHRWWRRHLLAWVACVPFAAVMFMRGAPAALVATMFFVGAPLLALVFVGQHVVIALVVLSGLHALAQPTADTEPPVC